MLESLHTIACSGIGLENANGNATRLRDHTLCIVRCLSVYKIVHTCMFEIRNTRA